MTRRLRVNKDDVRDISNVSVTSEEVSAAVPVGASDAESLALHAKPLDIQGSAIPKREPPRSAEDVARLLLERSLPGRRAGILVWLWIIAQPFAALSMITFFLSGDWGWFWESAFVFGTARAISRLSSAAADARSALLLPELDLSWLGPLINALAWSGTGVRNVARLRLTTLLPTASEEASATLSLVQRALLFDHLTPGRAVTQPDFLIAILEFVAATGDDWALAGTERLAEMVGFTGSQRRVREAARGALLRLEERVAACQAAQESGNFREITPGARRLETAAQLSPEAQSWLDEVEAETAKRPGMRFGYLLASWGLIVPYLLYQTIDQFRLGEILYGFLFATGTVCASQLYRLTLTPQQARLASKLANVDDVQAVGPLAEMTAWPDDRIKSMAVAALTRLLPRLKSNDTQLLSTSQRALLYQSLRISNARTHAEYLMALLLALEQVGDTAAIPFVRGLANSRPFTLRQRRVVEAAGDCLPFLEGCAQQNRDSQILLRATTSDDAANAFLLRPAGTQTASNPDLLVRVATPSEPA